VQASEPAGRATLHFHGYNRPVYDGQEVHLRSATLRLPRPVVEFRPLRYHQFLPDKLLGHITFMQLQQIRLAVFEIDRNAAQMLHQSDVYHQPFEAFRGCCGTEW
jgi:hypothetical protein